MSLIHRRDRSRQSPDGHWLPSILVAIYFLSLWKPSVFQVERQRWFVAAGLAALAYCAQYVTGGGRGSLKGTKVFWTVCGMNLLGATLSLFRASDQDALWKTASLGMNYGILGLMVPAVGTRLARRTLLAALVLTAGLWAFEIRQLSQTYGQLYYATFAETGANKNLIGFSLVLGGLSLLFMAVFWRPARRSWLTIWARVSGACGGLYLFYHVALIYARSGILAGILGVLAILCAILVKSRRKAPALLYVAIALFTAAFLVILVLPGLLERSPQWITMYTKLLAGEGDDVFFSRGLLLRKGVYLISQNPLLGVGAGGSLAAVSEAAAHFPRYQIHNAYLTEWAEYGILGLLSNVVLVVSYVKVLKSRFLQASLCDQAWLLLFIPLFFELNFIEMNTVSLMMVAILAGIGREQLPARQAAKLPTAGRAGRRA